MTAVPTPEAPVRETSVAGAEDPRELALALESTRAELLRSKRFNKALLGYVSRELRIPMTVVIGVSQLLLETESDGPQREVLEALGRAGKSLFSLLNDAFDYARAESGSLGLTERDFELGSAIRDACETLRAKAEGMTELRCEIDPSVPAVARGDAARLRQVITSVVGAVLSVTRADVLRLQVTAKSHGEQLELALSLTELADKAALEATSLSDLLRDDITLPLTPNGMGIALARRLIGLMGGSLEVSTASGTRAILFRVYIGCTNAEIIAASRPPLNRGAGRVQPESGKHRVLVAEDNDLNRAIVARALSTLGCEPECAANGREALDALSRREYAAVLMDCEMPELNGFQATAEIRKLAAGADIPIIALTANAAPGDRARCLAAGMDDYLPKPFSLAELRETLERYLRPISIQPSAADSQVRPVAASGQDDAVDFSRLEEIGSSELIRELTQIFLEDMNTRLDVLTATHALGDVLALERAAHAVKGACSNFGARRMAFLAQNIERAPAGADDVSALIAELRVEFERVQDALRKRSQAA
jgi:CheY-like chemotaxis protein/HPt (histidine-containing phosphotransfer) domain-containing protein